MSKRLPRTSQKTLDDLRKAASAALDAEKKTLRTVPPESFDSSSKNSSAMPPEDGGVTPMTEETRNRTAEKADETQSPSSMAPDPQVARRTAGPNLPTRAAFRKASGRLIVERHANFAAVAGLVPMPLVDLAAIAVVVERMLRKLSRLYGEPLDRHRSKQLAAAMLVGMAAPGIASFTTSAVLNMAPGPQLLGMVITSVSAAVLVRTVGEVYLSHLAGESGGGEFYGATPQQP
ncbi:YcjF family protein [Roseibium aggregatum]|uniref:YcjF family protein n=1 Tax=Roseibium aggregatum TaxID=187304 RepID=A0A939J3F5_9HYPH|nr:YcjF family protein [Roseibium aggregatum]MBN9669614.1 YcjF family protein [Roseibium aggregatum]